MRITQYTGYVVHSGRFRLPGAVRLVIVVLSLTILLFLGPGEAFAQSGERACGDFSFSFDVEPDQRRVQASEIVEAVSQGCDINATRAIIQGEADFSNATFEGGADFSDATFEGGAIFYDATFEGAASFYDATFETIAAFDNATFEREAIFNQATFETMASFNQATFETMAAFYDATFETIAAFDNATFETIAAFVGATFEGDAFFIKATFEGGANFRGATFEGEASFGGQIALEAVFEGEVWPPASLTGSTDLKWRDIRNTIPDGADRGDIYGGWENFFTIGRQYASASEVRTARRRYDLLPFVYYLAASFSLVLVIFCGVYYISFRGAQRSPWPHHLGKMILFSLDVLSPGIGPWKYDWKDRGGLPVDKVPVFTAIEAAFGWLILATGSALLVAWLLA